MNHKHLLLWSLMLFICAPIFAQDRTLTGTVTSGGGDPLPGVNVVVKGTTTGAITDIDGNFSIKVSSEGKFLVFSYIGFQAKEVEIGTRNSFDISLEEDAQQLSEVVITALGFEQSADNLGSTSSKIDGGPIVTSGETGMINGMQGKAAGVRITRNTGDPGAGSYIQIRGQSTITGDSQPLVIVDGIPISNSTIGSNTGGVSQQSRLNDINPDDIESIQVLKGASAAALWGSRAANGVILIKTKSGSEGRTNISFRSTVSMDKISVRQPLQNKFGQGSGGVYSPTASASFGDKISDRSGAADVFDTSGQFFEAEDGTIYYPIVEKNSTDTFDESNFDDIFGTGYFIDNNLSFSGGNEKSQFYASISNLQQQGIIKSSSDYDRSTVRFNVNHEFSKIFSMSAKSTYINIKSNRTQQNSNVNGIYLGLLRTAPDFDNTDYKGTYYASADAAPEYNRQRSYRRYLGNNSNPIYNNPLWTIQELTNDSKLDRFITSTEMKLRPTDWLDFTARGGVDFYEDVRTTYFPVNSAGGAAGGSYTEELYREREFNLDFIARVSKDITPDLSFTFVTGFNINDRKYLRLGAEMQNFILPDGPRDFSNALPENITAIDYERTIRTSRWYNTAEFGFKDQLYVNLSAVAEAASTFGDESDKTFYYPATDVAWKFTELPAFSNSSVLSFGKLRASWGRVGQQPDVYKTITTFQNATYSGGWGDQLDASYYGGGFVQSDLQGNPTLEPEIKTEWELGTDLRFFNDKLSLGMTYYQNKIDGLLFDVLVAPSTGFNTRYGNAAKMENKGFEFEGTYNLVQKNDFNASLNFNFNANKNKVTDLSGTESLLLAGFTNAGTRAVTGQPLGVLWGGLWDRDESGELILDDNGFPTVAAEAGLMGDPNPDWRGGAGFNVNYKGLALNVLFETFQGADISEATRGVLYTFGRHEDNGNEVTPTTETKNYNGDVIPAGELVRGNLVDWGAGEVLLDESWYTTLGSGFGSVREQFTGDGSWTRLREVSLSYTLSSPGFREKTKLSSIQFTLTGRNLILWTKVRGLDPETSLTGGYGQGLEYFTNPGTKSYLFSVTFNY
ncbi:SusC/RagA family TonB-linked outer membrane protein [Chondrinema litorale]|uniref:SusC/RagA family TonB-linked outer membrane protein n=1 Tax=Chondrinema litorale TaxID=2994555 RepID=UPI002542A890|nr:SusC/RagA family TonB-linked outer membrane protein [Chondrinema litorale]UZR97799.1 SusC/RagA family TonB-linked outer membrane protein [Chondrinema litorale]